MAELRREDIWADDLLRAPLQYADNLKEIIPALASVHKTAVDVMNVLKNTTSISGANKVTEQLVKANAELYKIQTLVVESAKEKTLAERELEKIERQIATVTARNTEEYRKQVDALNKAKKELKEKISLGDKDAKTINRQNASMNELRAALGRNRAAYKALAGEETRASKEGQELLRIIQQQDKDLKELSKSIGQHQDNVGNYAEATEALDNQLGGLIGRFKDLGRQLAALATNPYFLAIAGLVLVFKALQSAVTAYYTTSLEGEEALSRRRASIDAFFTTLKLGWAEVGKAADNALGEDTLKKIFGGFLGTYAPQLLGTFLVLEQRSQEFSRLQLALQKAVLDDTINGAKDELRYNQLIEDSRRKLLLTDEERLDAVRETRSLLARKFAGDIDQARLAIDVQEAHIQSLGGVIAKIKEVDKETGKVVERSKLLTEYTKDELKALFVVGEERQKLAELQAELINKESEYTAKRTSLLKIEAQLITEIESFRRQSAQRVQDAELEKQRQTVQRIVEYNRDRLENEYLSADERIQIIVDTGREELELLDRQKENEFNLLKRNAEEFHREEASIRANAIASSANLGIDETLALQKRFLDELLKNDEAYQLQKSALESRYRALERAQMDKNAQEILAVQRKQIEDELTEAKLAFDERVALIKQEISEGKRSRIIGNAQILEAQKRYNVAFIDEQIKTLEKVLQLENLKVEEAEKIRERIDELRIKLTDAIFDLDTRTLYDTLTDIQQSVEAFATGIGSIFQQHTEQRIGQIEYIEESNKRAMERELALAGDNAAQKARILDRFHQREIQLQKQKAAEQRRGAIFDKITSAVQAAIATALGVTKALATLNIPLAAAIGIAGGIQVAAILAKQIPQYELGTDYHPGGPAIVGEKGSELKIYPSGKMQLTPAVPTLQNLPAGTKVLPVEETNKFLALAALTGLGSSDRVIEGSEFDYKFIGKKLDEIKSAISNQYQDVFDEHGYRRYRRKENTRVNRINRKYSFGK